jgi:hypothetical protein
MLLLFYGLLHHLHDYLLQIVESDEVRSDEISIIMIIILLKEQQFFLGCEGRFNELDDISKGVVNGNIEVAKPEKICIFCYSNLTIVDSFYEFENFLFLLISFKFRQHFLCNKTVHFVCCKVVKEINGSFRFHKQFFIECVGLLPLIDDN